MADYCKYRSVRIVARGLGVGLVALAVLAAGSCSKKKTAGTVLPSGPNVEHLTSFNFQADTLLPGDIPASGLKRTTEPVVLRPDSLQKYSGINDSLYLSYNVIGLAAADYIMKGDSLKAEIVQCPEPEDAFGLFGKFRPDGIVPDHIGDESFQLGKTRYTLKGTYFLVVKSAETGDSTADPGTDLTKEIISRIGDQPQVPPYHILFPSSEKVPSSNRYYEYSYLGVPGFDQVYTTDYVVSGDTVTLFLALDDSGAKFLKLQNFAKHHGKQTDVPRIFQFDHNYSVYFDNNRTGTVIAGLARQKLVGAVPYKPRTEEHKMALWVEGLQK